MIFQRQYRKQKYIYTIFVFPYWSLNVCFISFTDYKHISRRNSLFCIPLSYNILCILIIRSHVEISFYTFNVCRFIILFSHIEITLVWQKRITRKWWKTELFTSRKWWTIKYYVHNWRLYRAAYCDINRRCDALL